jgi:hypothetical protein
VVRRKRVAALGRLCPEEEESRVAQAGLVGRLRPMGRGRAGQLGRMGHGHGSAENWSWAKVQEIKSFRILFGIRFLANFGNLYKEI